MDREVAQALQRDCEPLKPDYMANPLEEGMWGCPWRVFVSTVLTTLADKDMARHVMQSLLRTYPTPQAIADVSVELIADKVCALRLGYRRARVIHKMCQVWVSDDWATVMDLPGMNKQVLININKYC